VSNVNKDGSKKKKQLYLQHFLSFFQVMNIEGLWVCFF